MDETTFSFTADDGTEVAAYRWSGDGDRLETYGGEKWRFEGEDSAHYQREHDVLFEAIRTGREHNEAERGAHASLTSIMGRMATYSGVEVTWEQALASTEY